MINYCETDQCLRQFILSYFGDTSPCTCDKCSNCVVVEDEPEELYLTIRKDKEKNTAACGSDSNRSGTF
ncbi:RecQ family zinc-binding domain-containing protein [Eubacterium ramulus]